MPHTDQHASPSPARYKRQKKMINVSLQRACQITKALQGHTTHLNDVRSKQSSHSRKADDSEVRTLATMESSSFFKLPNPSKNLCLEPLLNENNKIFRTR